MKMVPFSRAFIRKRVISLATTASVAATSFALAQDPTRTHHVRGGLQYAADRQEHSEEQPFLSENAAAMHKTMADMTIKPAGDIDRDFVEMMVPHHEGAVDMATFTEEERAEAYRLLCDGVTDGMAKFEESLRPHHVEVEEVFKSK